jgi:hypothetical protein
MKTVLTAFLVAVVLALGHLPLTAAEGAKLRYLASAYFDDKEAGFKLPEGVACGANGQVVVGDTGNDRLVRFTFQDATVKAGGEVKAPQLSAPARLQLDSKGEIYALDAKQRRIVHLDAEGAFKAVLALDGVPPPSTIVPKSFAIGPADTFYVLDSFSARVLLMSAQGKFQKALALPAGAGFVTDLAVDAAGSLFLLDSIGRRMYAAEKDADAFAQRGGDLSEALATLPTSITASKGLVFVLEGTGGSVVALGRDGSFLSRQLTMGWEEGTLNYPSQMCINDRDEVFIADRDNSRIQVFQLIR